MQALPLNHLPLFVRCAIERLGADSKLRTMPQLLDLIERYGKTYGITFDPDNNPEHELHFYSAEQIAKRWSDYLP